MTDPTTSSAGKTKVAILGGGCGAMSAAFELTATPELRDKYEVTVYQQGWRLGGKGAAGRNLQKGLGKRIQEHGLHMWMGFYENAFDVIERCYAEWQKKPGNPFPTWREAFSKETHITLMQKRVQGGRTTYVPWSFNLDMFPGTPGKPLGPVEVVEELVKLLLHHHESHPRTGKGSEGHSALLEAHDMIKGWDGSHDKDAFSGLHAHVHRAHSSVQALTSPGSGCLAFFRRLELDVERLFLMLNLGWAILKGLVAEVAPHGAPGYHNINGLDFREWIAKHGAHPEYLDSAPVRTFYDLGFAYQDGDPNKPSAAAGVVLRVLLGIVFGTRGSPLWRMNAGMGDTIFSPLHQVLSARGVQFKFFHRVQNLGVSNDEIETITVSEQVQVLPGYELFTSVSTMPNFPCWPAEPDWDHIQDGAAIRSRLEQQGVSLESHWCTEEYRSHTLTRGTDFDLVVLGISVGSFPFICKELIAANQHWEDMVCGLQTVRTQAMQLWMARDLQGLGWDHPPMVLTTYAPPWSTWAVLSGLIRCEDWPTPHPETLHYFCGPLMETNPAQPYPSQPTFPKTMHEQTKQSVVAWLGRNIAGIWPKAEQPGSGQLNWDLLYDLLGGKGIDRLDSQYWIANIDPSERYVLSVPNSVQLRLDPGDSKFTNLYLAGDWTVSRLNAGSVEAAVESGKRCAQAISGSPTTILGEHSMT